jgi:predicted Zn-dependent protease
LKSLISVLKKVPNLRGWQVSNLQKRSTEVYLVKDEIETVRCNSVQNYALRIQTPVDDALMGESTTRFQGKPASLSELVDQTAARARLVRNPAFNFSDAYTPPKTAAILDLAIADADLDALISYAERIRNFRIKNLARFPLNSMELFFEEYDYLIRNHRGLEAGAESTRVVCDYVLTSPDNRHEIMGIKKRRLLSDLKLEEQLEEDASVLSDLEAAVLPPTGEFPVMLAGDALDNLFDFFVAQLDGHALFNRYSIFQKGDLVVRDAKEPLAVLSNAEIPGGMRSYAFDDLGFAAQTVKLIENSVVTNFLIDGRYADLLKIPRTSALMNIEVTCGATPYADFLSEGVLELSKFSTFQPNTISGAFSGEIRLGYLHKNGKRIPIKGGSVSGSTQAAFAAAFKSREAVQRASYFGPKGVFFERLTVAGE